MITEKQMAALLDIKDAAEALEDVMEILMGVNYALSFNEGALGRLSKIYDLIKEFSPVYVAQGQHDEDICKSTFGAVLEDKTLTNEEKAKILLGL